MPSFDVVSELQLFEVKHAVQNTEKEIATRFDFKGSDIKVELNEKDKKITITADNELQMENVYAMLEKNMIKRGVDLQSLDPQDNQGSGKQMKKVVNLKDGLDGDTAKKISKALKESDLKVSAAIQGDKVRVNDKKKDTLQQAMAFLKEKQFGKKKSIVFFGSSKDLKNIKKITKHLKKIKVKNLCGKLNLIEVAAHLKKCKIFIGNDSGLMHIASASGIPTLGLFGPSLESRYAPKGNNTYYIRTKKTFNQFKDDFSFIRYQGH